MSTYFQRIARNTLGRDLAVGDIHGHFSRLAEVLGRIRFDPTRDRLFSVGDLVDRGPECEHALDWLARPWFHAVRGNHEDYVVRHRTVDVDNWVINGGGWFQVLSPARKQHIADVLATLPIAMEVDTADGKVGIVHADCPTRDWRSLNRALDRREMRGFCMWSRDRITAHDRSGVGGIRAVVCGHTPLPAPVVLGNVHHIDTAGWTAAGHFTIIDLADMSIVA